MSDITSIKKGNKSNHNLLSGICDHDVSFGAYATTELMNLESYSDYDRIKENYEKFSSVAKVTTYVGENTDYTPQGVWDVNGEKFITEYKKEKEPKILYVDKNGNRKEITLDLPKGTHAGGITYLDGFFYVSSDAGEVATFSYSSITDSNGEIVKPKSVFSSGLSAASYLTSYNGKLYVGTFNENRPGEVKSFDVSGWIPKEVSSFTVPEKIQGMAITKDVNGKEHLILSKSHGRNNDSKKYIYDYDVNKILYNDTSDGKCGYETSITAPPMLEQVSVNSNGKLDCLFESCANQYSDGKYQIESLYTLDISKFF